MMMTCLFPHFLWSMLLLLSANSIAGGLAALVRPPLPQRHNGWTTVNPNTAQATMSRSKDSTSVTNTAGTFSTDRTTITATTHEPPRHLLWQNLLSRPCRDSILQQQMENDPSIFACSEGNLQWDPDGLLTAVSLFTFRTRETFDGFVSTQPNTAFVATYKGQNGGFCNNFDACFWQTENVKKLLDDQYAYDCSNVYCGVNAKRSCDGIYEDTECPAGTSPPPSIPSYAQVSCELAYTQELAENTNNDQQLRCASTCAAIGDGLYQYSCTPAGTTGCFGEQCFEYEGNNFYGEVGSGQTNCFTFTDTQDSFCFTSASGVFILESSTTGSIDMRPLENACSVQWNGVQCSCTVCGFDEMYNIYKLADCSEAAGHTSILNECDGTSTGIFSVFAEEFVVGDSEGLTPPPVTPTKMPPSTAATVIPIGSPQLAAPSTTGIPLATGTPTSDSLTTGSPTADGIPPTGDQEPNDPALGALGLSLGTKIMLPSLGASVLLGLLLW